MTLWFRNISSLLSEGDANGTWQRFIIVATPQGPNNEGGPSSAPANGGGPNPDANYLHTNPYPNTAAPGQTRECEAGNEVYNVGQQVIGNVPGNQGTETEGQSRGAGLMARAPGLSASARRFAVGAIALVVLAILVYLGFSQGHPVRRTSRTS